MKPKKSDSQGFAKNLLFSNIDIEDNQIENKEDKPQTIRPYDLRHTWAIRLATEKRWADVSDSDAAQAMGHDVATHRKHYQRWISSEAIKRKQMDKISLTKR